MTHLTNTGKATLVDLLLTSSWNCGLAALALVPNQTVSCNLRLAVSQAQFDAWDQTGQPAHLSAMASGRGAADSANTASASANVSLSLSSTPHMELYSSHGSASSKRYQVLLVTLLTWVEDGSHLRSCSRLGSAHCIRLLLTCTQCKEANSLAAHMLLSELTKITSTYVNRDEKANH
jgi:hypothetical protein